ncbi:MAG: Response regulator PleD [Accumulibacter sp.]|uniref:sensor domain-containing diguanylate cyclase n=1 Tax=Accumulibacter sp. TaxID=2053492 RepID=UPI0011FD4926|nr:diguanylate cyclase [Accumulibacter sp.]QKS27955.1 MAG: diguanylate cyclase [Candidatus Accumulibacter similis]TLD45762.1 MAG: Response regulator PleD [Accumulibacter sp.]
MQRENIRHVEEWARPRTVVLLTLLLLAALWAVVIASLVFARDDSIAAAGISLQRLTHALEQQTRQQFRLLDTVLAASENWLQDHPAGDPHRDSGLRRLVDSLRDSSGDFFDIRLLAAGTDPALQASPAGSDRSERQPGGSRLAFGRPTTDPATARVHLPVVRPVNNRHANGLQMVAMVDLQALSHGYDAERLRPGGAIALLSPDGTVLAQAAEDRQLVHSLAGGHLFSRHLPQRSRAFVVLDERAGKHPRLLASYSSLPDFPLVVIVLEDYDVALAGWQRQGLWTILLALGVTIPLTVVAWRSLRLLRTLAEHSVQLQELAISDQLTGVSSRQHFVATLADELALRQRRHLPLAVMLLDIDFFRRINDGYGHAVGDQVLLAVAQAAKGALRQRDLLARFGGGQFAVLLPDTEIAEALLVADRIRALIGEIAIPTEDGIVRFSVSVGASEATASDRSTDDLLKRAAQALQSAAAAGHDRVVAARSTSEPSPDPATTGRR